MKVLDLDKEVNNQSKQLRPLAMERNPKENLFAILAKNYFKVNKLNDDDEFEEHKLTLKRNNVKLNYVNMTWDPNNKNILYLLATPISNTAKKGTNTNLYYADLEKDSQITEVYKLNKTMSHITMSCNKNKSILANCTKYQIEIFDVKDSNKKISTIDNNSGIIYDCKFSPLDENLLIFSADTKMFLYDIRNVSKSIHNYCIESKEISSISWHPFNREIFCSGSMANCIRIWDINDDISSKAIFKTSKGCSKVSFLKSNPNYIMSSYQSDIYNIHLWNLKLRDIPEYQFSGHSNTIIGFDNDIEGKRLISCDKKGLLIINKLNNGFRFLDNITTNIVKFNNDNEIYCFHDIKIKKENIVKINNNNGSNDNSSNEYSPTTEKNNSDNHEIYNKEKDNIKSIYMLNFHQPGLIMKNKKVEKEEKKMMLNNDITLSINKDLKQYYIYTKDQINILFRNYIYYIERNETMYTRKRFSSEPNGFKMEISDYIDNTIDELDSSEKLYRAISANLEYAKNTIKNYIHIYIWNMLKYMASQQTFKVLYDRYSGKVQKKKKKNRKNNNNNELNKSFEKEKNFDSYKYQLIKSSPLTDKLMLNVMINQISRIIDFLIDDYGDIYLTTTICYLFKPILFTDDKLKIRVLRLIKECINNIKNYQLYLIANHLLKYGPEENNKIAEKNEFKFSCKKCKRFEFKEGKCQCGKELLCENCHKKTSGLLIWCSECGHVEHLNHWSINDSFSCKACGYH